MTARKSAIQTALLSIQGLRRRRLGHIGPNHYPQNQLDKWGRKKTNGVPSLLAAGGRTIPAPRASLLLGVNRSNRKRADFTAHKLEPSNLQSCELHGENISCAIRSAELSSLTNGPDGAKREETERPVKHTSDLVVVLDMDECLIHSQFLSDRLCDKYRQFEDRPAGSSPFQHAEEAESIIGTTCESFQINLPDGDLVHVNKRPNLDLFLKEITRKFQTYIFTAAMEVYAAPVLNELDPLGHMFRGRFYREHCVYNSDLGSYAKDLGSVLRQSKQNINCTSSGSKKSHGLVFGESDIAFNESRVVLVDNNPLSFLPNPSNGILVSSFYDDPKDDTLEAVMELLNELDESEDVRPILDEKFGLKEALTDVLKASPGWRR